MAQHIVLPSLAFPEHKPFRMEGCAPPAAGNGKGLWLSLLLRFLANPLVSSFF